MLIIVYILIAVKNHLFSFIIRILLVVEIEIIYLENAICINIDFYLSQEIIFT